MGMRQMKTSEKPRDVSGVELLMNNHQGHKAEIEARQDNFEDCKGLGKELLSRNHYASNEIKEKLNELINMSNEMHHRWEERWAALERLTTFELKELRRRQEEDEQRRREEISRHSAGADKTDGEKSEAGSIRSGERDGDEIEGMLVRKHEWESTTKKASNRSWDKVCVVLKGTKILFYKDQKSYRSSPDSLYRGEPPMELLGGEAEVATDYTKKKHVFRLKVTNGGECLFQASDDEEMSQWVGAINSVAEAGASGSGSGRAQTLPAGQRSGDEPKKRSFFTLKKK